MCTICIHTYWFYLHIHVCICELYIALEIFKAGSKLKTVMVSLTQSDTSRFSPRVTTDCSFSAWAPEGISLCLGTMWYENHTKLVYWVVWTQWGYKHEAVCVSTITAFDCNLSKMCLLMSLADFTMLQSLWLFKFHFIAKPVCHCT